MITKTCSACKQEKNVSEFHKRSRAKDGFCCWCKICVKEYGRQYYYENIEKQKAIRKQWRIENADLMRGYKKKYDNKPENKQRKRTWERARRREDSLFRDKQYLSRSLLRSLKNIGQCKKNSFLQEVGYTKQQLDDYLKPMRDKPCPMCGCSFENGYQIDHIYPTSLAKTRNELINLYKLENLQLLCPTCNLKKHAKIPQKIPQYLHGTRFEVFDLYLM